MGDAVSICERAAHRRRPPLHRRPCSSKLDGLGLVSGPMPYAVPEHVVHQSDRSPIYYGMSRTDGAGLFPGWARVWEELSETPWFLLEAPQGWLRWDRGRMCIRPCSGRSMAPKAHGSGTRWIGDLKAGGDAAVRYLWERYLDRLVWLARSKLRGIHRPGAVKDEEDAALSAFASLPLRLERSFHGLDRPRRPLAVAGRPDSPQSNQPV
jgi:hypothetical protein